MIRIKPTRAHVNAMFFMVKAISEGKCQELPSFSSPEYKGPNIYLNSHGVQIFITPNSISLINRGGITSEASMKKYREALSKLYDSFLSVAVKSESYYRIFKSYVSEDNQY